jgi:hypothetical protein
MMMRTSHIILHTQLIRLRANISLPLLQFLCLRKLLYVLVVMRCLPQLPLIVLMAMLVRLRAMLIALQAMLNHLRDVRNTLRSMLFVLRLPRDRLQAHLFALRLRQCELGASQTFAVRPITTYPNQLSKSFELLESLPTRGYTLRT